MFNFGKKAATVGQLFQGFADELARIRGEQFAIVSQCSEEMKTLQEKQEQAADEGNKADKLIERLQEIL